VANEQQPPTEPPETRVEQTLESPFLTGKKAMVTALVAIIMNPVSLVTGYLLNHALQNPRFNIEYVSETFFAESGQLQPEVVANVVSNKVINPLLRDHLMRLTAEQADDAKKRCTDWLSGGALESECYGQVQTTATGLLSVAETERSALKENLRRIDAKSIETEGIEPMQMVRPEILALGADRMAPALRGQLSQFEAVLPKLRAFVAALTEAQQQSNRTGEMTLTVGVLNSGDSDGVIKSRADLNFGPSKSLWLYTDPNGYVVIKAHSFQEITFRIGGSNNGDAVLTEWKDAVRKGNQLSYEIALKSGSKSIRGHEILNEP
jgi:hypothetical protein